MCDVLQLAKSTFYYEAVKRPKNDELTKVIVEIFHKNRKAYGTRKLKVKLMERGFTVSRRRIGRIMKDQGLVSTYTIAQYKPHKTSCNEAKTTNVLDRKFDQSETKRFVVSDLTYVAVRNKWHYICVLIDLFNREIIGYSAGKGSNVCSRLSMSVIGMANPAFIIWS